MRIAWHPPCAAELLLLLPLLLWRMMYSSGYVRAHYSILSFVIFWLMRQMLMWTGGSSSGEQTHQPTTSQTMRTAQALAGCSARSNRAGLRRSAACGISAGRCSNSCSMQVSCQRDGCNQLWGVRSDPQRHKTWACKAHQSDYSTHRVFYP